MAVDQGLVSLHLSAVQQVAAKAQMGQEITDELFRVVAAAQSQFAVVPEQEQGANLKAFRGRLKLMADPMVTSDDTYRGVLAAAVSLLDSQIG
ncbi:hypothetical protein IEN52_05705 [Stenotrophomonas rhizophila]|nr:hypothetical protein [Stenotrophomonas rhizophila]MCC7663567.1 hypothetical protein [Stenotrophomonas rhizophila]